LQPFPLHYRLSVSIAFLRASLPSVPMQNNFLNKRLAHLLGYAGLVPFVLLTLGCWLVDPSWLGAFIKGQLAYGIAILSFLGGIHWSAALVASGLSSEQSKKALAWSIVPALVAWSTTMVGGFGFAVLMIGFFTAYQVDKKMFAWYGLPDWFLRLRFRLTCVVIMALALTVIAANVKG
jgi:Protein of unknown function (DUF3429)